MSKQEALDLIDEHKNQLLNPVVMLNWTWLRVLILQITDQEWEILSDRAAVILSR